MPGKRILSSSESEDEGSLEAGASLEAIKQKYRSRTRVPRNPSGRQFILMEASEEGRPKYRQELEGEEEEGADVECTLLEGEEEEEEEEVGEDEEERWLSELVERAVGAGEEAGGEKVGEGEKETEWVPPKGKKKKKKAAPVETMSGTTGTLGSVKEEELEREASAAAVAVVVKTETPVCAQGTERKKPPNNLIIHPDDPTDEELCALLVD